MAPGRKAATVLRSPPSAFDLSSDNKPPSGAYGTVDRKKSRGKKFSFSMASGSSKKKKVGSSPKAGRGSSSRAARKASHHRLSEDAAMPPVLPVKPLKPVKRASSASVSEQTRRISRSHSHTQTKSWGRMKEWAQRSQASGEFSSTLKSTRSSNGGFVSVNPLASKEEERQKTIFLKKPSTRARSNTLASQLDKKRFELDVPLHQRKKSIHGNKEAIAELKQQEEDEKEMRRKRLHNKKSSRVLRMRSGQEPTAPHVATDSFLQGRGLSGKETRLSHLEKATARAHTKVKKGQNDGFEFLEADSDVDEDQDEEATQYYRRLHRLKSGKSLPDFM